MSKSRFVVAGAVPASRVVSLGSAQTINGLRVRISVKNGTVWLNETTRIVKTDVMARNGVSRVIDAVLLPKHGPEQSSFPHLQGEDQMRKSWIVLAALCLSVSAGSASAAGKGSSMFSIGLGQGVADGYSPATVGTSAYLAPITAPETSVGAEYWYSFSDDYAIALSGAYGFSSMKWDGATAGDPEVRATGTSIKVRVGGDRIGKVGDRLLVFMGPGIEYWTGKQKLETGSTEDESESVSRFGISGRIGGFMMLTEKVGIMGQVGHTFGMASVEDGAKTTWMPSSFQASWGLTFGF